jgi:hypothetical protein
MVWIKYIRRIKNYIPTDSTDSDQFETEELKEENLDITEVDERLNSK